MSLYLIAVLPGQEINKQVAVWKEYMFAHFQCRVAMKSPAHITLIPPFHLAADQLNRLEQLLTSLAETRSSFDVELRDFAAFPPRVIYVDVLPSSELALLKRDIEDKLIADDFRIKKEERTFHPHVTIANRDLKKEDFPMAWQHFKKLSYSTHFRVSSINLLRHDGQVWNVVFDARLH